MLMRKYAMKTDYCFVNRHFETTTFYSLLLSIIEMLDEMMIGKIVLSLAIIMITVTLSKSNHFGKLVKF